MTTPGVSPRSDEEAARDIVQFIRTAHARIRARSTNPDVLDYCAACGNDWPCGWIQGADAVAALLVEREDQDRRLRAVEAIRQDILSEMPPEEWGRSAWWDAMDSVEKELRRALSDPPPSVDREIIKRVEALRDDWRAKGTVEVYESAAELADILDEALHVRAALASASPGDEETT